MFHLHCALVLLTFLLCLGTAMPSAIAQQTVVKKVQFKRGTSAADYSGTVRGYDGVSYRFTGKAGQKASIKLSSRSTFLYFNLVDDRTASALETKSPPREVTNWSGVLPHDGSYTVQVYLVRAEARRNGKAKYRLSISLPVLR